MDPDAPAMRIPIAAVPRVTFNDELGADTIMERAMKKALVGANLHFTSIEALEGVSFTNIFGRDMIKYVCLYTMFYDYDTHIYCNVLE
jgi:hypothetical protein